MNEMLLSFIVPIYNVEEYLDECVQSLLKIPFISEQEIILVDDGSSDSSGEIADSYASRFIYIKSLHKPNGGLSDARNYGLKYALGKYVCFVDSDDMLDAECFSKLSQVLNDESPDILLWDAEMIDINGKSVQTVENDFYIHRGLVPNIIQTGKSVIMAQLEERNDYSTTVWLGAYRRDFLTNNQLWFEKGLLHEDEMWTPKVLLEAEKVKYYDSKVYLYRVRDNSIMRNNKKNYEKNLDSLVYIYSSMYFYIDWKITDNVFRKKINANISRRFLHRIAYFNAYGYPNIAKKLDKKLIMLNSSGFKDKMRSLILMVSGKLYCSLSALYRR